MTVPIKAEELKWIEDDTLPRKPPMEEFTPIRSTTKKSFVRRMADNVFVPFGLVATTVCLTMGLINMSRGNSAKQQFFMRGRVAFQAFTLAAMCIGVAFTTTNQNKEQPAISKSENK